MQRYLCGCVGMDVRVWLVCVIKNICAPVCVCNIEREKWQITNPITVCTSGVLLAPNGENMLLCPNKLELKAHFLRYHPQIWNTTYLDLCLWFSCRFRV